ncbi:integrator complex subunit 12 isoform X2 [Periplaneta americana]|uniref:integrator complex subunit 12 isoform X2 n=1 Tax=Periplaneta americana TaxID=6978 RepID=UPI0037E7C984
MVTIHFEIGHINIFILTLVPLMMASFDLDPTFARALRLMHSKAKDSEDQLRSMLDEAIRQRHGSSKTLANLFIKKISADEVPESNRETIINKRPKSSDISKPPLIGNSSPAPSPHAMTIHDTETINEDSLQPDDDDDGLALEILEEDLTCVVCRGMDVVARNQLVECIECHSLYHQECHQPPVAEADMNDPRSAWYCSNCTKAMSKMQGAGNNSSKQSGAQSPYNTPSAGSTGKPSFTAVSSKSNTSPNFSTANKAFGGLPLPAAKTPSISSKPSIVAANSQKCVMPNINIISADKRLQIMKKKAAKMQEKRKHSK